jgi:uncharacterized coiled-coil protein SlyX
MFLARHCCIAALPVLLAMGAGAQTLDERMELQEARATVQISAARIAEQEKQLDKAKEQLNALSESLASANGDGQKARTDYEELRVQMEGLGIAALDKTNAELQERLLSALSDLRILEQRRRALVDSLINLSEAALAYAKNTPQADPASRDNLDKSLAAAEKALGNGQKNGDAVENADLQNAQVVSLKDELGIAVLNVGSRQGVHPGMPFSIYRKDKPIARALVVDVRGGICGAVINDVVSKDEPVKVGDTGKVDTSKS